ncbi:MAG TPA: hypothetical protein VFN46_10400 [Acetobacteraceae bacterium]|nr:hypothetical protein [Acetobacteraceae bacterium]
MRQAGFDIRRAGHFNLPGQITNPRSGEHGIIPDRHEAALLDLDLSWIERQDEAAIASQFHLATAFPDAFGDGYNSLRNLCHQLRSLDRLWSLIELMDAAPDTVVAFLRPDLLYLDRLEVAETLAPLIEGRCDLVVPIWQGWGGINDRFAFANAGAARIYATRWRLFADACLTMGTMHSERFLDFVVRSQGLRTRGTHLRAVRMRADGRIAGNDAAMIAPAMPDAHMLSLSPMES